MGRIAPTTPTDLVEDDSNYRLRPPTLREPAHQSRETELVEPDELRQGNEEYFADESNLAAPPPRSGMKQYWKRAMFTNGETDVKNWSKALRQGWRPRDPETITMGRNFWPARSFEGSAAIMVGGLVLCEMAAAQHVRLEDEVKANNKRLNQIMTEDHERASAEGMRMGGPRIVRDEVVQSSRRPPTMAD